VRADLGAEPEDEAAAGDRLQIPRGVANVMGVRANAIAIAVPSSMDVVCSPATASGTNGSCLASKEKARS
jgi:hypothetical protein